MSDISRPTTRRTNEEIERYRREYERIFGDPKDKGESKGKKE
jgi:hypothetical protein